MQNAILYFYDYVYFKSTIVLIFVWNTVIGPVISSLIFALLKLMMPLQIFVICTILDVAISFTSVIEFSECVRIIYTRPVTRFLWPPYGIGQAIIFLSCDFCLLLLFFPRLMSAVRDWMSTILPHMAWP